MPRNTYKYNPETLTFEKYRAPRWYRVFKVFGFIAIAFLFSVVNITLYSYFFPTPTEKAQRAEIDQLSYQIDLMSKDIHKMDVVLDQLAQKDKDLYRVIFEAEPIPESIWEGGIGGVDRQKRYASLSKGNLLSETSQRLYKVKSKLVILSNSYEELAKLARKQRRSTFAYSCHPTCKQQRPASFILRLWHAFSSDSKNSTFPLWY